MKVIKHLNEFMSINLNGFTATALPNSNNDEPSDGNFQLEIENGVRKCKLKLTDLNSNVLFQHIFVIK